MSPGLFAQLQSFRSRRAFRGLWLSLSLLVLGVQTALPAHQETHPLGEPDIACHYCVLGGHLSGMPGVAPPLPPAAARIEAPDTLEMGFSVVPFPRTRFSRGPPSTLHA
jgi:hypothetical protein